MIDHLQSRFLTLPDILERVPWSYPTLRRRIKDKLFPPPTKLGGRIAWLESDYDAWFSRAMIEGVKLPERKKRRTQSEESAHA